MYKRTAPPSYDEFAKHNPEHLDQYEDYVEQHYLEQDQAEDQFYNWWNTLDDDEKFRYENTRPEAVAKRLKTLRKKMGATQDQVASVLGVTKQTISNYETGQSTPSNKVLDKLCRFFHVPLHYILGTEASQESAVTNEIIARIEYIKSITNETYMKEDEVHPTEHEWILSHVMKTVDELTTAQLYDIFQVINLKSILNITQEGLDYMALIDSSK